MAIKTIPLREVEEKIENMFEAVCVMSGQARRVLDDRIVQNSIRDAEIEEYSVFDEIEEKNPEDYIEHIKPATQAINEFLDGDVKWKNNKL